MIVIVPIFFIILLIILFVPICKLKYQSRKRIDEYTYIMIRISFRKKKGEEKKRRKVICTQSTVFAMPIG